MDNLIANQSPYVILGVILLVVIVLGSYRGGYTPMASNYAGYPMMGPEGFADATGTVQGRPGDFGAGRADPAVRGTDTQVADANARQATNSTNNNTQRHWDRNNNWDNNRNQWRNNRRYVNPYDRYDRQLPSGSWWNWGSWNSWWPSSYNRWNSWWPWGRPTCLDVATSKCQNATDFQGCVNYYNNECQANQLVY